MRLSFRGMQLFLLGAVMGAASLCQAQPLVTEGLTVYYSFDSIDEDGLFADGSGNGLNGLATMGDNDANGDGLADIRVDTGDKKRGGGSVFFDTQADQKEEYVAVCDPAKEFLENCQKADDNNLVPTTGFSLSAWVKAAEVGSDQSVWQVRAAGGGFTHTQVQGNGNMRVTLRGDVNSDTLVNYNEPPAGNPIPFNEWVHFAATYEKTNPAQPGVWATYINGEKVGGGEANGNVAGDPDLERLGGWGQGAFIGLVPDFNRQLVGHLDELYVFRRALTEAEIQKLFKLEGAVTVTGDFNNDGQLTVVDIDLLSGDVRQPSGNKIYDVNGDNVVNGADRETWVNTLKKTYMGDADLDGKFDSTDLIKVFQGGEYEDGVAANSGWGDGDWNGDAEFDSSDFITAFQAGGYDAGPRAAVSAVPEPSSMALLALGSLALLRRRK